MTGSLKTASVSRMVRPETLAQALDQLAEPGAIAVSGGVSLSLARHAARGHTGTPADGRTLVAIGHLDELRGISVLPSGLRIGPAHRLDQIARDRDLTRLWPAVAQAAGLVATARIRRVVTLGGNIAAFDGSHDPPVALVACGAEVALTSRSTSRVLPLHALTTGTSSLAPGELITDVLLPERRSGTGSAFLKFLPRGVWEYACVQVAATLRLHPDGRIVDLSLAVGSVQTAPLLIPLAQLIGEPAGPAAFLGASEVAQELSRPHSDVRGSANYKRRMIAEFTRRVLALAHTRAKESQ